MAGGTAACGIVAATFLLLLRVMLGMAGCYSWRFVCDFGVPVLVWGCG